MSKITREEVLSLIEEIEVYNIYPHKHITADIIQRNMKRLKDFINQPPQLDSNIEEVIDNIFYELLMSTDEIEYNRFILKTEPRSATDLANDLKKIKQHIQALNDENERLKNTLYTRDEVNKTMKDVIEVLKRHTDNIDEQKEIYRIFNLLRSKSV